MFEIFTLCVLVALPIIQWTGDWNILSGFINLLSHLTSTIAFTKLLEILGIITPIFITTT